MASRASFADDSRMIKKALPKSQLLKDYLLDDMSSCSSNGFRSYPRRQCCTTLRFLVEIDLTKNSKLRRRSFVDSEMMSQSKPKQFSVLQRASAVMINAFKHFPFAGAGNSRKPIFLPRSLSRKLLKRGFWKKTDDHNKLEIKGLKSFGDLIKEKETTPPQFSTTSTAESWSDSDVTATTGNSSEVNLAQNDVINDLPENKKMTNGKRVGATTPTATLTNSSATTENAKKKWQNEQEEQSSPVSVMDFPCDNDNNVDDEDGVSYVFQHRHIDGTKTLMHKSRRFEGVSQLEPIRLEDRIAQSVLEPTHACYMFKQEGNQAEKKAMALLELMKSTNVDHSFRFEATESLLLGFFKERIIEEDISYYEMLQTAREWINDQTCEMFLDWDSQKNRQTYIREMEKMVKWSKYDDETEIKDIGLELEYEVFMSLVDDILLDFNL